MFEKTLSVSLAACMTLGALGAIPVGLDAQSEKPAAMSDRDARKLITDSPWAKRSKLRSTAYEPAGVPTMENPGMKPGGLGAGGPGHGWVPPTADQRISEMNGPQFVPCLGWGVGTMSHPSPTSDECKAAWKSLEVVKQGLPAGLVVIQWESAAPIRAAQSTLEIKNSSMPREDVIMISVIAHPLLQEIDPSGQMKPMIQDGATLLRNGKNTIGAIDVAFIETERKEAIVHFFFPRSAIRSGDKDVTFRFEMSDTVVEAKFNLKEMFYKGQLAL
jgi:hypothetical protein